MNAAKGSLREDAALSYANEKAAARAAAFSFNMAI
jgi:hypothetical protein